MKKYYMHTGEIYCFDNVRMECGMLYGKCTVPSRCNGKYAWLDPHGFQFEHERRVEAIETSGPIYGTLQVPPGYHFWGGEIRRNYGQ